MVQNPKLIFLHRDALVDPCVLFSGLYILTCTIHLPGLLSNSACRMLSCIKTQVSAFDPRYGSNGGLDQPGTGHASGVGVIALEDKTLR